MLKRLVITLTASLGLVVLPAAAYAGVSDFTIPRFEADYYLSRDNQHIGRLKVVEHIEAEFPATDQNHGLLRALPKTYQGHSTSLQVLSVTDGQNQLWPYSTSTQNDNLVLKIGEAGRYVHGRQTYIITYTEANVTAPTSDHDGHFWDTNGDGWSQIFGQVTAHVHLTPELSPLVLADRTRCFTGARGSTASDCSIATGEPLTFTTTRALGPGENLTYELGFPSGTFATYTMPWDELTRLIWQIAGFGILPPLLALIVAIRRWRRHGRDPEGRGTIVPEYLPPKDLSTLASGLVLHERFQPQFISAQIIDLAVRHYLKIYEVTEKGLFKAKADYEVELVRTYNELRPEEISVITLLFGEAAAPGARVGLGSLANKLYQGAGQLGKSLSLQLAEAGSFRGAPHKAGLGLLIGGIVLVVAGFFFIPYGLGVVAAGLVLIVASYTMPVRTSQGVAQREYLLGLKLYIKMAEADRLKVLQSPHGELTETIDVTDTTKLVKLYEALLPYAVLFGLEREWAKEFAQLYQQPPDWYSGSASFNAGYFASALHGFGAASTASFTAPSSSGSGGFSGGGGGGGGGGGW